MKSYSGITWSNLELEGLLEDEDSCVTFTKVKKHFELYPFQLGNLTTALDDILKPKLNSYDAELNGLVLAYKNPKVLTPKGAILYDSFYVHIDVEADFYIFKPKVGKSLKGFVNKIGTNHVGVLVHKAFNVSIPRPEDDEDWPGYKVKIGQEVRFTLEVINFNSRLPYFRGSFQQDEYLEGCKLYDEQVAAAFKLEFTENLGDEDLPTKNKSKNKKIVFDSDSEQESNPKNESKKKSPDTESSNENKKIVKSPIKKRKRVSSSDEDRKSCIIKLSQASTSSENENEVLGGHEKKSRKNSLRNSTEEEKELESIVNGSVTQLSDDVSVDRENDSSRKSKKSKRKHSNLEDGKHLNGDNELNADSELSRIKTKKRKEASVCGDEEIVDNKAKLKLPKEPKKSVSNSESEFEASQNVKKKKKKKKHDNNYETCDDTEDEKRYKKTIIKDLMVNAPEIVELKESKKSKKRKIIEINDDIVVDTEDEKNYKSSLKPLIQCIENNSVDDFIFKEPKKKKHKKKHSELVSQIENEIVPAVTVKCEPESESEEKRKSKKKSREKNKETVQEIDNDKYESDLEDRKKAKALLKERLNIKNEDEVKKKVKKEKNKDKSFQYEH